MSLAYRSQHEKRLRKQGFLQIAGIDEAGRGPLAGSVIAAACILPDEAYFESINDSKQLTPEEREYLYELLLQTEGIVFGVGEATCLEVDQHNILQATLLAMQRAVHALKTLPDYLLIDGNQSPQFKIPLETLVKGDSRSISIAAASIIAKVTRDRMMIELDKKWPEYGFKRHKGYATPEHLEAIEKWGPCLIHRETFDPIKSLLLQAKK